MGVGTDIFSDPTSDAWAGAEVDEVGVILGDS
jgi:hypothetical protein